MKSQLLEAFGLFDQPRSTPMLCFLQWFPSSGFSEASDNNPGTFVTATPSASYSLYTATNAYRPPQPNARSYMLVVNGWKPVVPLISNPHEPLVPVKKILWRMMEQVREKATRDDNGHGTDDMDVDMQREQQQEQQEQYLHKHQSTQYSSLHKYQEGVIKRESNRTGYPVDVLNALLELCAQSPMDFPRGN